VTDSAFVLFERAVDAAGPGLAICRRPEYRPRPDRLTLWEGQSDTESRHARYVRQAKAVARCERCPVLDACSRWLEDVVRSGLSVDGVVAGRVCEWRRRGFVVDGMPAKLAISPA